MYLFIYNIMPTLKVLAFCETAFRAMLECYNTSTENYFQMKNISCVQLWLIGFCLKNNIRKPAF